MSMLFVGKDHPIILEKIKRETRLLRTNNGVMNVVEEEDKFEEEEDMNSKYELEEENEYNGDADYGEELERNENEHSFWEKIDKFDREYEQYIDTISGLKTGMVVIATEKLINSSGGDDIFENAVVFLTWHGGKEKTKGYIINNKLNHDESEAARDMLREFDYDPERHEKLKTQVANETRLWLGVGGPVRDSMETWTPIHTCVGFEDVTTFIPGVGMGASIFDILMESDCLIKLFYGSTVWSPGQLDYEISQGLWVWKQVNQNQIFSFHKKKKQIWEDMLSSP